MEQMYGPDWAILLADRRHAQTETAAETLGPHGEGAGLSSSYSALAPAPAPAPVPAPPLSSALQNALTAAPPPLASSFDIAAAGPLAKFHNLSPGSGVFEIEPATTQSPLAAQLLKRYNPEQETLEQYGAKTTRIGQV